MRLGEDSALVREHAVALLHAAILSEQQGAKKHTNTPSQRNADHEVQTRVTATHMNTMEKLVPIA